MSEKRKHRRANLLYYLQIHDLATEECIGHLIDISLSGLQMISKSNINPDKNHHFNINLPDDHLHKSFTVKAKTCWSKTDVNPDYIASGHSFTELSPEGEKFIKLLISRYELRNGTSNNSY